MIEHEFRKMSGSTKMGIGAAKENRTEHTFPSHMRERVRKVNLDYYILTYLEHKAICDQ